MKRKIELELYHQDDSVTFYTFRYVDEDISEFDKFFDTYDTEEYKEDIDIITYWTEKIGRDGANDRNFRPEKGSLKAIPLDTSELRLYCFKISDGIVILGNGGVKTTATYNEDPTLNAHAENLLSIGSILVTQIRRGTVTAYNNVLYEVKPITFEAI